MVLGILDAPGEEYTTTKNLRFPRTAQGGIMSALLAQKGFTGPSTVIEGNQGFIQTVMGGDFEVEKLLRAGERFKIMDTVFKAFSTDATMQGHLTATLTLVKEHDIKPEDVEKINIWAGTRDVAHTGDLAKRYPKNKESADHSSYYCTAIAILEQAVGPAQFTPEKFEDPKVKELNDKITFEVDPDLDRFSAAGISEIETTQGAKYKCRVDYPKGHPHNPMSDEELEEKFRAMASELMDGKQIKDIITTVRRLEELDDISELMRALVFK